VRPARSKSGDAVRDVVGFSSTFALAVAAAVSIRAIRVSVVREMRSRRFRRAMRMATRCSSSSSGAASSTRSISSTATMSCSWKQRAPGDRGDPAHPFPDRPGLLDDDLHAEHVGHHGVALGAQHGVDLRVDRREIVGDLVHALLHGELRHEPGGAGQEKRSTAAGWPMTARPSPSLIS
jgi:hypothetical protein